jgi:hypothetical protein
MRARQAPDPGHTPPPPPDAGIKVIVDLTAYAKATEPLKVHLEFDRAQGDELAHALMLALEKSQDILKRRFTAGLA